MAHVFWCMRLCAAAAAVRSAAVRPTGKTLTLRVTTTPVGEFDMSWRFRASRQPLPQRAASDSAAAASSTVASPTAARDATMKAALATGGPEQLLVVASAGTPGAALGPTGVTPSSPASHGGGRASSQSMASLSPGPGPMPSPVSAAGQGAAGAVASAAAASDAAAAAAGRRLARLRGTHPVRAQSAGKGPSASRSAKKDARTARLLARGLRFEEDLRGSVEAAGDDQPLYDETDGGMAESDAESALAAVDSAVAAAAASTAAVRGASHVAVATAIRAGRDVRWRLLAGGGTNHVLTMSPSAAVSPSLRLGASPVARDGV